MALPTVDELMGDDIYTLLGIEDASEERKRALLEQITNLVDARVARRISDSLSEEEAEEFGRIANNGNSQEVIDFLVSKNMNLPAIVSEEAIRARVEVVTLTRLAQEK